jgi:GTP-binding protein
MSGRAGENIIIDIPLGTVVRDKETKEQIADMTENGQLLMVARGGKGGRGNQHFATSIRQAPRFAEQGMSGGDMTLRLELKMIADVGIIGCPNAGKSTLLSRVSKAHPEIASYPFTTKSPNLGVVKVGDWSTFVAADIPGLLEGAHSGTGLGIKFLKHIERTRILVHIVDAAGIDGRKPLDDYKAINKELKLYSKELAKKPQIVAFNKMDLPDARDNFKKLKSVLPKNVKAFAISGVTGAGIKELMLEVAKELHKEHK